MEPEHKTKNLLNQKPNSRKKWVPKQCETSFQSTLQVQGHIETRSWIRLISALTSIIRRIVDWFQRLEQGRVFKLVSFKP